MTKEDLKKELSNYPTKEELKRELGNLREEMQRNMRQELQTFSDKVVKDLIKFLNPFVIKVNRHDKELRGNRSTFADLEERLETIEQKLSIS